MPSRRTTTADVILGLGLIAALALWLLRPPDFRAVTANAGHPIPAHLDLTGVVSSQNLGVPFDGSRVVVDITGARAQLDALLSYWQQRRAPDRAGKVTVSDLGDHIRLSILYD